MQNTLKQHIKKQESEATLSTDLVKLERLEPTTVKVTFSTKIQQVTDLSTRQIHKDMPAHVLCFIGV